MTTHIVGVDPSYTRCGVSDGERHVVLSSPVHNECATDEEALLVRVAEITNALDDFLLPFNNDHVLLYIEAPIMRVPVHGGSHIYQLGWLMHGLRDLAQQRTYSGHITDVRVVKQGTYLKALFGKGAIPDTLLAKEAYKKFGIEIEGDRGLDKLEAELLYRYGRGIAAGEFTFVPVERAWSKRVAKQIRATKKLIVSESS